MAISARTCSSARTCRASFPRLPGNLSSGFIVRTGGFESEDAELVIGLTDEMRAEFPIKMPMNRFPGRTFPGSGLPAYRQRLIDAAFEMRQGGETAKFDAAPVLDTGGPNTHLIPPDSSPIPESFIRDRHLREDVDFRMIARTVDGDRTALFDFQPGLRTGWNRVTVGNSTDRTQGVNAGITTFFRHDGMFDVENGVVGFKPVGD